MSLIYITIVLKSIATKKIFKLSCIILISTLYMQKLKRI